MTDTSSLLFVDPDEQNARFRVVLWAAPGEGKSVGAASAPTPNVVISADRPGAYRFARRHHGLTGRDLREVRYENTRTLDDVLAYLHATPEVQTVTLDPFGGIYDRLVDQAPRRADGDPDYQKVNKRLLDFLYALRLLDVHVVIVAHEKLSDGKRGDGKLYPQLGGPSLINKVLAESDIAAHVERVAGDDGTPARYEAQLAPVRNLVCKESTGLLGDRAALNLTEWFEAATAEAGDLPWSDEEMQVAADEAQQKLEEEVA